METEKEQYYREKLETSVAELRADLDQSSEATQTVKLDTSIGRLSRMDAIQSQQMALELKRRQQNQLLRLQNALKRLDEGNYGLCGRCGKPISADRLDFQPDAVFCIRCTDKR